MSKNITDTNAKSQIRFDLELIAKMIKPNSTVLDIGCGDGELLEFLQKNFRVDARGLELSHLQVSKAVGRGLSVTQGNAETDLNFYPDRTFDYAILSQTLQAMHEPKKILQEMLRIAEFAIISLPNFANIKNRWHLCFKGTMPVSNVMPFQWYDTSNIHLCSIKDFENLCQQLGFTIQKRIYITAKHHLVGYLGRSFANLFADYGIFLITKSEHANTGQEEFCFARNLLGKGKISSATQPAFFKHD